MEYIPIILVKEYYWCPVQACLKLTTWSERETYSMKAGRLDGNTRAKLLQQLARRRITGEEHWEQEVISRRLGLRGRIDLLIDHGDTLTIIEAKLTLPGRSKQAHIKAQLAAYMIAAEETYRKPVLRTLLYLIERDKLVEARITPHHRTMAENAAKNLWRMLTHGCTTQQPARRIRCRTCAYREICPARLLQPH